MYWFRDLVTLSAPGNLMLQRIGPHQCIDDLAGHMNGQGLDGLVSPFPKDGVMEG